jgi:hypothetical protein
LEILATPQVSWSQTEAAQFCAPNFDLSPLVDFIAIMTDCPVPSFHPPEWFLLL